MLRKLFAQPSGKYMIMIIWYLDPEVRVDCVAVKERKLSYFYKESPLFTLHTHYGNPKP